MMRAAVVGNASSRYRRKAPNELAMSARFATLVTRLTTAGARFGDLEYERRTTAIRRYFYVRALLRAFRWAGDGGDTFGYAGVLSCRFANPDICPPPSIWRWTRRVQHPTKGYRYAC